MKPSSLSVPQQAELVLRLPAEERARFLLESPKPMALVRALPDGEFYLTVREIGPQGALPLLVLASASQIAHLFDLEGWRKDRFDAPRSGAWVAMLVEAGDATLLRFARSIDDETLILLFRLWARVKPLEIDHEEPTKGHGITEFGDERGFIAPDGAHLLSPERSEHALAARRLAEAVYHDDRERYLGIVRAALFELPSDVEETALHWRTSRLEEHGFPTWEEALSIYAPPEKAPTAVAAPPAEGDARTAPRASLRVLGSKALIVHAADALTPEIRERVLFGLMALAHRVLVADGDDAGSVESHARVIERSGAYVGLALDARGIKDATAAASVLAEVSVLELFREGYALAAGLQSRARLMLKTGWGGGHARAAELIDAPLRARVEALLLPRPLYVAFADDGEAADARDFKLHAEIEETRVTLDLCEALGATLLADRGVSAADVLDADRRSFEDTPRFSTLLLTALAWHATRSELRIDRLPAEIVSDFLRTTASRRTADTGAAERAMIKLLESLDADSELARRPAAALRAFAATCLDRLAADCGNLDPGTPVTPRVVGCLRLA